MAEIRSRIGASSRVLITMASFIVIVTGLKIAAPILIPFALAGFIVVVTRPAVAWLQRRRLPTAIAIALVVLLVFGVVAMFVSVATQSLGEIRVAFPRYITRLQAIEEGFVEFLRARNIEVPSALQFDVVNAQRALDLASGAVRGAAGIMSTAVLILIIAIFGMIEANGLPSKLRRAFGSAADLGGLRTVIGEVQKYLAIKTVVSVVTGLLIGVWVAIIGLDFPVFWGLVAFVLNYVPTVGSIIAAVPAVLLALIQFGFDGALLTAIGYVGVNLVLGNVVEPTWLGRRMGLSPLVVMLSLVFWGWMWGPIGALLSVPLTLSLRMMLESTEDYRWIAILLAPSGEKMPPPHEPAAAAPQHEPAAAPPAEVVAGNRPSELTSADSTS